MKKILIMMALSSTLFAVNPYVSKGGSLSDIDDSLIDCRASGVIVVGIDINLYISIESRFAKGLSGEYMAISPYVKPKYKHFYGLVGIKHQMIDNMDDTTDISVGIGAVYNHISIDVEHAGGNSFVTLMYTYNF